jgi:hypothetical protein
LIYPCGQFGKDIMAGDNSQDFDAFVKRQQIPNRDIDWAAERDKWLTNLRNCIQRLNYF